MVVKVYISGISGNKEVKKRQQRVLMILDSKCIKYDVIDITEPGKEGDKDFMQNNAKSNGGTVSDPNPRSPLPPQVFNDDEYCGDYDQFDLANEVDTLEQFLKVEVPPEELPQAEAEKEQVVNGNAEKEDEESKEKSQERDSAHENIAAPETQKEIADKEKITSREATPADRVLSKETSPTKDAEPDTESKEKADKEPSAERQKSVEKDITPKDKSPSPSKEKSPSPAKEKSPSPAKEKSPSPAKEKSPSPTKEKSPSPDKEDKAESEHSKETTPAKDDEATAKLSKEATPEKENLVNENGTISSREQSEEKVFIESKKDNPSESLITSEQAAAAE